MKKGIFSLSILSLFILTTCASHKKAVIYGGLAGSLIGGFLGHTIAHSTTPNPESLETNQKIGALSGIIIGALSGGYLSHVLYSDNPENKSGPDLFPPEKSTPINSELSLKNLGLPSNTYIIPSSSEIPESIRSQIQKQIIIEHQIPTQLIQQSDGSTLIINGTTATEHRYLQP